MRFRRSLLALVCWTSLAGGLTASAQAATPADLALINRLTFGISTSEVERFDAMGRDAWLAHQLHPDLHGDLPPAVQAEIDALPISQKSLAEIVFDSQAEIKEKNQIADPALKKAAQKAIQDRLNDLDRQAQMRSLLRDIYSKDQLNAQMTWFWTNYFNIFAQKRDIRQMTGAYEDEAIRPHALGHFRDLLEATLRHPAMLRYLDNDQNANGHINENYAREIMELHSLGVGSGYTQKDVQELARILTGVGVSTNPSPPNLPPALRDAYVRQGLFEFNPARHDFGDKVFLGYNIRGSGFAEVEAVVDLLSRNPATARHVSQRLALYFLADAPSPDLVDHMSRTFLATDGDMAQVLKVLIESDAFRRSLGHKYKDPVHFVVSALRAAYDKRVIVNTAPAQNWINRMGEGLYGHDTPDGYPLEASAWNSSGQIALSFEIARQIGGGPNGLFRPAPPPPPPPSPFTIPPVTPSGGAGQATAATSSQSAPAAPPPSPPQPADLPGFPVLANRLYFLTLEPLLLPETRAALDQAVSQQDWNAIYLSSPDFRFR